MAGRPKTKAMKIHKAESGVVALLVLVTNTIPEQHLDDPDPKSDLGRAWYNALWDTQRSFDSLRALGDLLRQRAGITELGPCEIYKTKIKQSIDEMMRDYSE